MCLSDVYQIVEGEEPRKIATKAIEIVTQKQIMMRQ